MPPPSSQACHRMAADSPHMCWEAYVLTLTSPLMPGTMHDKQRLASSFRAMRCDAWRSWKILWTLLHPACRECAPEGCGGRLPLRRAHGGLLLAPAAAQKAAPLPPAIHRWGAWAAQGVQPVNTQLWEWSSWIAERPMHAHSHRGGVQGRMPTVRKMLSRELPAYGVDMACIGHLKMLCLSTSGTIGQVAEVIVVLPPVLLSLTAEQAGWSSYRVGWAALAQPQACRAQSQTASCGRCHTAAGFRDAKLQA